MIKELEFLLRVCKEASCQITDDLVIESKDDKGDLITNFDIEIEKFLINEIKKNYPTFDIISEEFNSNAKLTKNCFVIDPVDGTINFAHGLPLWGIQMACIKDGNTIAAVINCPKLNEIYYADKNGAYLNKQKIHVNNLPIDKCLYVVEGANRYPSIVRMQKHTVHARNTYCAAINFAWVAAGKLGGTIFRKDSAWDYVPGQYIVKQAGGFIYNADGSHIAANSDEFVKLLNKEASYFEGDKV